MTSVLLIIIMVSKRIQFRLNPDLLDYVEQRAKDSKITPSEFLRLLIVRDMDTNHINKNLALVEVTKELAELKKSIGDLEQLRDQLSA